MRRVFLLVIAALAGLLLWNDYLLTDRLNDQCAYIDGLEQYVFTLRHPNGLPTDPKVMENEIQRDLAEYPTGWSRTHC